MIGSEEYAEWLLKDRGFYHYGDSRYNSKMRMVLAEALSQAVPEILALQYDNTLSPTAVAQTFHSKYQIQDYLQAPSQHFVLFKYFTQSLCAPCYSIIDIHQPVNMPLQLSKYFNSNSSKTPGMQRDKDRLYIALYDRPHAPAAPWQDKYYWALMIGPRDETPDSIGHRFNITPCKPLTADATADTDTNNNTTTANGLNYHYYEVWPTPMTLSTTILARIMIGKVRDPRRLRALLANVPLRPADLGWDAIAWTQDAVLAALADSRAVKTTLNRADWHFIRDAALWFVGFKVAARRYDPARSSRDELAPAWDLTAGEELAP
ncbi:hypothetical protein HJFPF1_05638 [Paramyrothecium foliicola]|nr:hypothetical protein HJFPF1_05638 [Paramyrothecium foliicola]